MNLKNGYKTLYEVIESSERVFLASKTGLFADAEEIARFDIGAYKVVYQRGDEFFGIDTEGTETRLEDLDKIFVESVADEELETELPDNTETVEESTEAEEPIPQEEVED